jgi:hypothetical protein
VGDGRRHVVASVSTTVQRLVHLRGISPASNFALCSVGSGMGTAEHSRIAPEIRGAAESIASHDNSMQDKVRWT